MGGIFFFLDEKSQLNLFMYLYYLAEMGFISSLVFILIAASNVSLVTNAFDFKSAQVF